MKKLAYSEESWDQTLPRVRCQCLESDIVFGAEAEVEVEVRDLNLRVETVSIELWRRDRSWEELRKGRYFVVIVDCWRYW